MYDHRIKSNIIREMLTYAPGTLVKDMKKEIT